MSNLRPSADSAYVADILRQPESLARLLDATPDADAVAVLQRLRSYPRVVLTGMGASLFALYPTYRRLAAAGLDVSLHETAELLSIADGVLRDGTLLWVLSQSGASAEVVALAAAAAGRRVTVLATTNDTGSSLAAAADAVLEIHSGQESTVGTGSYLNSLAALALAEGRALGPDPRPALAAAPSAIADYLLTWGAHVDELATRLPDVPAFVLGRGASLAAAWTGALITKEAARRPVEGMSVPQFRHGPLEMADPSIAAVVLAGDGPDEALNRQMFDDLTAFGVHAVWLSARRAGSAAVPALAGPALPLAEIIPLQLMSVMFAERAGQVPGEFRQIGKVTTRL